MATFITGASSGIGLELARVFAKNGHDLVLTARRSEKLTEVSAELTENDRVSVTVIAADLSHPGRADEIAARLQSDGVVIDNLVNNAGLMAYGAFSETDWSREAEMLAVNMQALTRFTKIFLPGMLQNGSGHILNIGSTGAFVPGPLEAVYCATKAYVLSFSEALATELEGTGVTVTCLCPGATRTELQARAKVSNVPLLHRWVMDAPVVAEIGYNAMMKGRRVVVPGAYNKLQVFGARIMPRKTAAALAKELMTPKD
jgi:short-subunit dehydrogenase